ncbi:MAG: tRNA (adenosine(37)-N6)-threonylcarbamoyltransferase complex transferase subunit TsaD [Candidatus Omnitrophica bacterium]|nr:tRNA (adenosine(37)-N6)-threonylcarbamoyltransferase complex transferase subunit TsaD [Candidatus Omnitrophota bacterium]MCF7892373.1 tRNA (adenosine(37)-N6)-threonylcarbamoyltransferase complex transferase subunit TsaD [Candidatus Omnitrophota bacterium]MCF7917255.1 tRNA (adenosine(37)-N6)-threonylcarbamoyltransferase complex transferase subunit TsaD [Candidatus Omnitrophota bacterium]
MYILGIETSCDETSIAILKNLKVLSNITISSLKAHKKYGGIIPEIASRAHLSNIDTVLNFALEEAKLKIENIDLIAVTYKPGLIGALLVGLNFAKALSLALKKPLIGINHLHAHFFSSFLNYRHKLKFPFLGLVVSGGHTSFYQVKGIDNIKTIGSTQDDACGEVLDKVAVNYGLGYPGGPIIDKLFEPKYKNHFKFKCGKNKFNLSFSGIKTALVYKKNELEKKGGKLSHSLKKKLLSSFQFSLVETIVKTIVEAAKDKKIDRVSCGGGVMANSFLRETLKKEQKKEAINFLIPPLEYTQDNGAMVAGLGFCLYNRKKETSSLNLIAG